MSPLRKTKNITITSPIPSILSPHSVLTALQNHPFMLNLSPIVTSHSRIPTPSSDSSSTITPSAPHSNHSPNPSPNPNPIPKEPAFANATWYRVSETVPVIGSIDFLAAFQNTEFGQESLVRAPAGLRMWVRYFVESAAENDRADADGDEDGDEAGDGRGHRHERLVVPDVAVTPATPVIGSDGEGMGNSGAGVGDGNGNGNGGEIETEKPASFRDPASSTPSSTPVSAVTATAAAGTNTNTDTDTNTARTSAHRTNDWDFLGSQGRGYVLREECTVEANMFLMPFITFNFESVHRRMQARLFEILAEGKGPVEGS